MMLKDTKEGIEYIVISIDTDDGEFYSFVFYTLSLQWKDGRYNFDYQLAEVNKYSIEMW